MPAGPLWTERTVAWYERANARSDYAAQVNQPFESLEEACDFWMTYMGLEGEEPREFFRRFLGDRLPREGDAWVAPLRKRAAVLWWRV